MQSKVAMHIQKYTENLFTKDNKATHNNYVIAIHEQTNGNTRNVMIL